MQNKTAAEAMEFAKGLDNTNGDADVFIDLWNRKQYDIIRGHFPAFASKETPASVQQVGRAEAASTEAPEAKVAPEPKPRKSAKKQGA